MATTQKKATARVVVAKKDESGEVKLARNEVLVVVPKTYLLTLDDGTVKEYAQGVYPMLKAHAEHWWSVTQGVEIKSAE